MKTKKTFIKTKSGSKSKPSKSKNPVRKDPGIKIEFCLPKHAAENVFVALFIPVKLKYAKELIGEKIYKRSRFGMMTPPSLFLTDIDFIDDSLLSEEDGTISKAAVNKIGITKISNELIEKLNGGVYIFKDYTFKEVNDVEQITQYIKEVKEFQLDIIEYEIGFVD